MFLLLSYMLALVCLIATLLPLIKSEAWWVRAADFPRLQIAILAFLVMLGLWLQGALISGPGKLLVTLLGLAVVYHLQAILPYTSLWSTELKSGTKEPSASSFRLLVANVLMDNRETERLIAMIADHRPDLILAVETDQWWCDRLEAAAKDYPFKLSQPIDNTYGMFLASKLELIEPEIRFLLKEGVPSFRSGIRLPSGETAMFYALHPEPPSPTEAKTSLPRDAELVMIAKEIGANRKNTIVAGDLNDVAWSSTSRLFRRLGRMLDPRIGRGLYSTFHAAYWPLRWPLDHVFVSDDFVLQDIERLGPFGSDHFPILVTLDLVPMEARHQKALTANGDDHAEADDKLARGQQG